MKHLKEIETLLKNELENSASGTDGGQKPIYDLRSFLIKTNRYSIWNKYLKYLVMICMIWISFNLQFS